MMLIINNKYRMITTIMLFTVCFVIPTDILSKNPFYKYILELYNNKTKEELDVLREFWKSDKFESKLKDDTVVKDFVNTAKHLRNRYESDTKIYSLGQSLSYLVLTAQLIEALENANPDRYDFIAFSHGSLARNYIGEDDQLEVILPLLKEIGSYYFYLDSLNFFDKKNKIAVICEQVESGSSIIIFEEILSIIKNNLAGEMTPIIKWYIHIGQYAEFAPPFIVKNRENKQAKEGKLPKFDFMRSIQPIDITKVENYPEELKNIEQLTNYPNELNAHKNEGLRLVASFPPKAWYMWHEDNAKVPAEYNPSLFKPGKEAEVMVLRILDFIIKNELFTKEKKN